MAQNHYQLLGVKHTATEKEIRHAYRMQAKKYHPDINPSDEAKQKLFELQNALNALCPNKKHTDNEHDDITKESTDSSPEPTPSFKPRSDNKATKQENRGFPGKTHSSNGDETWEFQALKLGVPVKLAMQIDSESKFKALTILGKDKVALAIKFYQDSQADALTVVLANKQPAEDALDFTAETRAYNNGWKDSPQFQALKLGVPVKLAMQIDSDNKLTALRIVLQNHQPAEDALDFTAETQAYNNGWKDSPQFKALKLGVPVKLAMQTESYAQVDCIESHSDNYLSCLGLGNHFLEEL